MGSGKLAFLWGQVSFLTGAAPEDITHLDQMGFPGSSDGKESACHRRAKFNPWVTKIPWRRAWQPPPVFWPGESRWMEATSLWGHKESVTIEQFSLSLYQGRWTNGFLPPVTNSFFGTEGGA